MSTKSPAPATHLILVCCHAIYLGGPTKGISESEWLLASFQHAEVPTFTAHLQAGLSLLSQDPSSLLILSGSKTRPEVDRSEAQSYLSLGVEHDFWSLAGSTQARERILCEEQALDSFANLLFSLLLFWKTTGRWPERITVVSHEFKRRRFEECHFPALRLGEKGVFVGVDPEYMQSGSAKWDAERSEAVVKGENERGLKPWLVDGLGKGMVLKEKRKARNPWGVEQEFFSNDEERKRSGVKSVITDGEEYLIEGEVQPWE